MRLLDHFRRLQRRLFRPLPLALRGERAADRYLRRKRYKIVARRSLWRRGELDLVAVDGQTVVFVEVKTRGSTQYGSPEEAVTLEKQRRITRAALLYLRTHGLLECPARFDVVAVLWKNSDRRPKIEHFQDAFTAVGVGQMHN
jgi:putative endonuclease